MVVDRAVDVFVADPGCFSGTAVFGAVTAQHPPAAAVAEPAKLLHIEVQQFPGRSRSYRRISCPVGRSSQASRCIPCRVSTACTVEGAIPSSGPIRAGPSLRADRSASTCASAAAVSFPAAGGPVDRLLYRERRIDVDAVIARTPDTLLLGGRPEGGAEPQPTGQLTLTAAGAAACTGSEPALPVFLAAVQVAAEAELETPPEGQDSKVTFAAVAAAVGVQARPVTKRVGWRGSPGGCSRSWLRSPASPRGLKAATLNRQNDATPCPT